MKSDPIKHAYIITFILSIVFIIGILMLGSYMRIDEDFKQKRIK